MVRIKHTKPVQRRKRQNLDIENNAPNDSAPSSLQSQLSKQDRTVEESSSSSTTSPPVTSLTVYVYKRVATKCPCTGLTLVLICVYLTIGCCLVPNVPVQQRRAYWKPVTSLASAALSVLGFTVNVVQDVHEAVADGRTSKWTTAIDTLQLFLSESGLEYEWSATLHSHYLLADLVVLQDIQKQQQRRNNAQQQGRKHLTLASSSSLSPVVVTRQDLQDGQYYMRYATSVYGREMIASAELQTYGHVLMNPTDTDAQVIAQHTKLVNGQVWYSDLTPGENHHNHESLRTIVACDHTAKAVVVSIRGTYSLSGIIVDLAGFCEAFCGGWAHAGFAAAARHTWHTVWETVLRDQLPNVPDDYDLVFTGHSMGAGVACLITILLHYDTPRELKNRRIRCFAMAPPPVFAPLSAASQAVANTVAYVHAWDCVPSLSVDAIRRFMNAVSRIDAVMKEHPVWQVAAERYELGEPAPDLVHAYEQQVTLRPLEQAPTFFVPARSLIWLERLQKQQKQQQGVDSSYQAHALDPQLYANRILDVKIPDMMMDHMIPAYEAVFEQILSSPHLATPPFLENNNPLGHALLRGGVTSIQIHD